MTDPATDIISLPRGARFLRADLHIHSFGSSHDVKDSGATPEAIVAEAARERLDIIALTDHNEIGSVRAALKAAENGNLMVVPGVELSTPEGHLLCYLPDVGALERFVGELTIADRGLPSSHCQNSMLDCLEKLATCGGFAVLAHVDGEGGVETRSPGASPHKKNIICHASLLGIELKDAASGVSYSRSDPDPVRAQVGRERIERLKLGSDQFLARTLNSDAHTLADLGRNAAGNRKVTRLKMSALTFDGLRIAMQEADARVRLEDEIPQTVPAIRGIRFRGGFLDGQAIHFGPNLNCIIGGRGTGKSTTFEAIRCLTQQPGGTSVVDSDVWPDEVELLINDQAGDFHLFKRQKYGGVLKADEPSELAPEFTVECYGQGETHEISQRAQTDPSALLDYLDRFVDVRTELRREEVLRDELLQSQTEIEKARAKVAILPQSLRSLSVVQQQIATLEKAKAKEIIALQRSVQRERQAQSVIKDSVNAIIQGVSQDDVRLNVEAVKSACASDSLVVGKVEFEAITHSITQFEASLAANESTLRQQAELLVQATRVQLAEWRLKEQASLRAIEEKKRELEAKGVRVDMQYLNKLAMDEARLKQEVDTLTQWKPHLEKLEQARRKLLKEKWALRDRISTKRNAFAQRANAALRDALLDLRVSLKFDANAYSAEAKALIVEAMAWRTVQVPRADLLVERLTVPMLLEAVSKKITDGIEALVTPEGIKVFDKADARKLLERLSDSAIRFRLERCAVADKPRLSVTKEVVDAQGRKAYRTREFKNLSLGQQQSVLLALMLAAESNVPLLIDQPEDNLDGEFIYKSIVPVLRRAKERRQVIVVTHNANVAVLGDAELIVALGASSERAIITTRGSIDEQSIRDVACAILEGSREAFDRRARIYGSHMR